MASDPMPLEALSAIEPTASPTDRAVWQRVARVLYNHNPFYLLSTSFVLHGTAHWLRVEGSIAASPWLLMLLVGGYIAALAVIAWLIVHFGKVWDDARSVLLMIPLLFVELSLAFDETLLRDAVSGRWLLSVGLLGAIGISEALLCGLKMRLPWRYRVPYHAVLALLFLYPMSLANLDVLREPASYSWRIFLFSTFAAGVALSLLPAVRRGPEHVANNGTPWRWPLYPWSLFVILLVCVGFRAYALSLSFDPVFSLTPAAAERLENAFGTYYLIPLLLACGGLLLEGGVTVGNRGVQRLALLIPIVALIMASPSSNASAPYFDFLRRFTNTVGSPIWATLIGSAIYFGWACQRGVRDAEFGCLACLISISVTNLSVMTFGEIVVRLHPFLLRIETLWPWAIIAVWQSHQAWRRGTSWRACVALLALIVLLDAMWLVRFDRSMRLGSVGLLVLFGLLCIGQQFADGLAKRCRRAAAIVAFGYSLVGLGWSMLILPDASWRVAVALLAQTACCFAWSRLTRQRDFWLVSLGNLALTNIASVWVYDGLLRSCPYRTAVWSFTLATAWLLAAVLVSGNKAGWLNWKQICAVLGWPTRVIDKPATP